MLKEERGEGAHGGQVKGPASGAECVGAEMQDLGEEVQDESGAR